MSEPAGDPEAAAASAAAAAPDRGSVPRGHGAARPPNPDPLQGDADLWWFEKPKSSTLCFSASVGLSTACMIGAIVVIVDASYAQVDWQFGVAIFLCMCSFLVVFKLLVVSTMQHMSLVYRRSSVSFLMDGGGLDVVVFLLSGASGVVAGSVIFVVARERSSEAAWTTMHGVAVVFVAAGGVILAATVVYGVATDAFALIGSCVAITTRRVLARLASRGEGRAATPPVEQTASTANLVV